MTFLTTRYRLAKAPTPKDFERLSRLSTVYGIRGITLEGQNLIIEYDASRIHEAEVLASVHGVGVGTAQPQAIPLGGFDHTGESKDLAWPTKGLSEVNKDLE